MCAKNMLYLMHDVKPSSFTNKCVIRREIEMDIHSAVRFQWKGQYVLKCLLSFFSTLSRILIT